jgi:uncharacterized protein (DUF2236 family)
MSRARDERAYDQTVIARIAQSWRAYILSSFSGSPDGAPDWVRAMGDGNDEGFFGPGSAVWHVNGGTPVIVAGFRALLMQALHPGAMAGVHDWSRFKEDPLGRLSGTVRWVLSTTFDDRAGATESSEYVKHLHERVQGTYGDAVPYSANDQHLLRWVHLVFEEAFLSCHQAWGAPIPGGADQYVAEWAIAGELMGVDEPPRSEQQLRQQLAAFDDELVYDDRVADTVRFLRHPPLRRSLRFGYAILFAGAVSTLEPRYRRLLRLRRPWWPARATTRIALAVVERILGRPSSSERFAMARIALLSKATD